MNLKYKLTMTRRVEEIADLTCPISMVGTIVSSCLRGLTPPSHKSMKLRAIGGLLLTILFASFFLMSHAVKGAEINPPDLLEKKLPEFKEKTKQVNNLLRMINQKEKQQILMNLNIEPTMKPLGAGTDFIDGDKTLDFYKSKFDVFILGVSTSDCETCDETEILLDQFIKLCAMKDIEYKKKWIPVVRIDGKQYINMLNHEHIFFDGRPLIGLFSKGIFYSYGKSPHLNLFLNFINRHLYPIVLLNTKEAIESFRNTSQEWIENTPFYKGRYRNLEDIFPEFSKVTRVIAFVAQKSEYKYELSQLSDAAKKLGYRDDLRIAKVVDPLLVKEYKETMKEKWFEPNSINSIVVFSRDKQKDDPLNSLDLNMDGGTNFEHWINSASIEPVEELSVQSLQIMLPMFMPIFVAYVDNNYSIYGSRSNNLLKILNELCLKYPQYLFGYFKNDSFDYK